MYGFIVHNECSASLMEKCMDQDDPRSREQSSANPNAANAIDVPANETPTGAGSEAAEGIHGMGTHAAGERSGLDGRATGRSFRAGAERSGSEPLRGRTSLHESGYGGRGGEPRTSSDQRESAGQDDSAQARHESEVTSGAGVDARRSPFYEWLDNATIRELVHRSRELSVGERLMLLKGVVPGLVETMGLAEFDAFLAELGVQARRFQEAVDHPGEGRESRVTPGQQLGGPMPAGHSSTGDEPGVR